MVESRFTPWFGPWPPKPWYSKFPGEWTDNMPIRDKNKKCSGLSALSQLLGLAILLGLGTVAAAYWLRGYPFLSHILIGIGIAFLTAAILGLTVDQVLKRDLLKDAVETALGYLLPPPLQDEMRWIYDQRFLAQEHIQRYTIRMNSDGETVTVCHEIRRRVLNITDRVQEFRVGLAIDEWGFSGRPSRIIRLAYRLPDNTTWTTIDLDRVEVSQDALAIQAIPVRVEPQQVIATVAVFEETQRVNDDTVAVFGNPTRDPQIFVECDPALSHGVAFGHREQENLAPDREGGCYRLVGTLLPMQYVRVRWWRKQQDGVPAEEG